MFKVEHGADTYTNVASVGRDGDKIRIKTYDEKVYWLTCGTVKVFKGRKILERIEL